MTGKKMPSKDKRLEIRCSPQTLKQFKIYAIDAEADDHEDFLRQLLEYWRRMRREQLRWGKIGAVVSPMTAEFGDAVTETVAKVVKRKLRKPRP